jgi:hypothetical protein
MSRLRRYLAISIYLVALGAASARDRSDLFCFDHLVLPGYTMLARVGHPGTAAIRMKVGVDGSAVSVAVDSEQLALQAEIKSAMEGVRFKRECAGDIITLQMTFELVGPPIDLPFPRIVFEPPNRFTIISQPLTPRVYVHTPVSIREKPAKENK